MNKFQRIAVQIAKDELKKDKRHKLKRSYRAYYSIFKSNPKWSYEKCLDFKNWNKTIEF